MFIAWLQIAIDYLLPALGCGFGVLQLRHVFTGTSYLAFPRAALTPLSLVLISSIVSIWGGEAHFVRRVERASNPKFALLVHSLVLRIAATIVALASLYSLALDSFGLLEGNILQDRQLLMQRLLLLLLAAYGALRLRPYAQVFPVHLLDGLRIQSRDTHYSLQLKLLRGLRAKNSVMVTAFEASTRHYVEESAECKKWMTRWQSRVIRRKVPVKQLLRVYNEKNLRDDVYDRLEKFRAWSGYKMRMVLSPPELPIVDMYVEHGRYAILCLPADTATPFLPEQFVYISRQPALEALEQWFLSMWHHGLPLNESTSLPERLEEVRKNLEHLSSIDAGLLERPAEIVWEASKVLPDSVRLLVEIVRRSRLRSFDADQPAVRQAIVRVIEEVSMPTTVRHRSSLVAALADATDGANHSVCSTAVLGAKDTFWLEHLNEVVSREKSLAKRGVSSQRVFLATSREVLRRHKRVMNELAQAGCVVRTLAAAEPVVADFAIVDEALLIIDNGNTATESANPEDVGAMMKVFEATWSRAEAWPGPATP